AFGGWYFKFHNPPKRVPSQASGEAAREGQGPTTYAAGVGGLKVNTSPPGAMVTLGGLGMKKTPATFNANSGKYSLFIELDGYEPVGREVAAKESQLTDLGTITLQRSKSRIDLETIPPGANVLQGENSLGVTPLHNIEFPSGPTTFLLVLEGYLPREFKAQLISKELFKPPPVALAKPLPLYEGTIQASQGSVPLTIKLAADLKSGTMTQSSTRGDTVVKFAAVWDGATLRAKTQKVVSQPEGILWEPESFTLRFSDDGKAADYAGDNHQHTALVTITERSDKLRENLLYGLDGAGHFTSPIISDPDRKLRTKSIYKYDKAGRLLEETLLGKDDAVLHKIAYSY